MYETEANSKVENSAQIPEDVLRSFEHWRRRLQSRTVLPWSEHCTECVWPTCYSTCDLYDARPDGGCRRFVDGMVRIELAGAANSYLLKIRFKPWGKLWTPGTIRLHSAAKAEKIEQRDYRIGTALQRMPVPSLVKITLTTKRYGFKKRVATSVNPGEELPEFFLLECYNPEARGVPLSLTMRATSENASIPFQKLIHLDPGFNRILLPLEEITAVLDMSQPFGIDLTPNHETGEVTLYFGLIEFVTVLAESKKAEPSDTRGEDKQPKETKIKCVVWDLDNTLWDGVLVEDGPEQVRLKNNIAEVIRELDQRGVLHSIASKNNPEEALQAVKTFHVDQYFLSPQISWQPKSEGLKAIAQQLNIGMDSLLFVDDSEFELGEVAAACPEVKLLPAEQYLTLLERSDCQHPITSESRERRKLYQVEASRKTVAEQFSNDYMAFLRHCEIRLTVRSLTEENLTRVHELTQRTNQMNFSGNRYDRDVLREVLSNPHLDTFVLSCEDRFGSYGVIGFSIVERREPRMTDLMFSCRIQSKRVEHAFLSCIVRKYIEDTGKHFYANYRKTPRNAPSGKVFADLGMEETEDRDGVLSLRFSRERTVPEDGIIQVTLEDVTQGTLA